MCADGDTGSRKIEGPPTDRVQKKPVQLLDVVRDRQDTLPPRISTAPLILLSFIE